MARAISGPAPSVVRNPILLVTLNEGWAIDEHTTVEAADGTATTHGDGTATRARALTTTLS